VLCKSGSRRPAKKKIKKKGTDLLLAEVVEAERAAVDASDDSGVVR
jgi:hypothetical protein